MRTTGASTRRRPARAGLAASALVVITLAGFGGRALAQDSAADTAKAAALYEPLPTAPTTASTTTPAAPESAGASSDSAATTPASGTSALVGTPTSTSASPPAAVGGSPAATGASRPQSPSTAAVTTSTPPATTETVIVPASMPAPSYVKTSPDLPPSTTEIPQAAEVPRSSTGAAQPSTADIDNAADAQAIYYEAHQNPQMIDPQLHSLQDFINEGDGNESSPLGMELREDRRELNSGEIADGLMIVDVHDGSAAAKGGLHACKHLARNVLQGVAVAASLFFPPAVLAVPLLEQTSVGETYDMIIGVDGARVVNFLDFEDHMRDVQPGEIVYLSIVRNGDRMQVPLHVDTWSQ